MGRTSDLATPRGRLIQLDIARTIALIGMVIYHFTFDLGMFGYVPPDTAVTGFWAVFARLVAGSFLFLAGVSLYLAHGNGIRWQAFARRLLILGVAAFGVTVATYFAVPQAFIFYGILHSIAVASIFGLAFLRLPVAITVAAAVFCLTVPQFLRSELFDTPWLVWVGLGTYFPRTMDFEPLFPWLGPFLLGLSAAKLLGLPAWKTSSATSFTAALAWPGKHSLPIYLVHQPILISVMWLVTKSLG